MGAGDDQVIVGPALEPMPAGTARTAGDEVPPLPSSVNIGRSLRIGTGEGNDRVHVGRAWIRGALDISTDGGNDSVVLGNPPNDLAEPVAAIGGDRRTCGSCHACAALRAAGGIHANSARATTRWSPTWSARPVECTSTAEWVTTTSASTPRGSAARCCYSAAKVKAWIMWSSTMCRRIWRRS